MDFGLFMSSTDPLHEGVVDSGHFGPPTNPFHKGQGVRNLLFLWILKISDPLHRAQGGRGFKVTFISP